MPKPVQMTACPCHCCQGVLHWWHATLVSSVMGLTFMASADMRCCPLVDSVGRLSDEDGDMVATARSTLGKRWQDSQQPKENHRKRFCPGDVVGFVFVFFTADKLWSGPSHGAARRILMVKPQVSGGTCTVGVLCRNPSDISVVPPPCGMIQQHPAWGAARVGGFRSDYLGSAHTLSVYGHKVFGCPLRGQATWRQVSCVLVPDADSIH